MFIIKTKFSILTQISLNLRLITSYRKIWLNEYFIEQTLYENADFAFIYWRARKFEDAAFEIANDCFVVPNFQVSKNS